MNKTIKPLSQKLYSQISIEKLMSNDKYIGLPFYVETIYKEYARNSYGQKLVFDTNPEYEWRIFNGSIILNADRNESYYIPKFLLEDI